MLDADDNLPLAPPGFCPLNQHLPIVRYQRHLPHWRQSGATYFVTFRLVDSLPQEKLRVLDAMRKKWLAIPEKLRTDEKAKIHARAVLQKVELWLDSGYGACWLRDKRFSDELRRSIFHQRDKHYQVPVGVIMPNHCHLIIRPFESIELEHVLGQMKSVSARFINQMLKRTGPIWQQESYDRLIRDTTHLHSVVQYIGRNPARAGLPPDQWLRYIAPEWEAAGWGFIDELP